VAPVARNIEAEIRDVLASSRVGAILGPRQAGKSTLAIELQESGLLLDYYTLDREPIRSAALEDPDGFMAGIRKPAVIDEIQRAPDLMLAIKLVVDRDNSRGQFLITGSANLLTFRAVADALPGRVIYVNLWPFSQGEIEGRREGLIDQLLAGRPPQLSNEPTGRPAHAERVVRGGFPNAYRLTDRQRSRYFESYVGDVLERDLPIDVDIRAGAEKPGQLLRLLAARSGNLANFSKIATQLELDGKTAKAHVALLEELFLIYRLRPWSRNLGSRHVRTPKLLLTDTGLMSSLIGVDAARYSAVDQGELAGMLLETFVTMELVKQQTWADARVQLFFYRDQEQREVDVVIETPTGDVAGVEVKAAAAVGRADTRGLRFLRDKLGDRFKAGVVLYTGARTLPMGERIWAVPLRGLWTGGDGS
jgi:predicted AAA+ superfamily ATPase